MSGLDDLYQSVILDHDRSPRNFRELSGAQCREAEGYNPLCGDRFRVMLRVEDGVITDASFLGAGCAISKASASLMTEFLKGRGVADAERLFEDFRGLVAESRVTGRESREAVPAKLRVFEGVTKFPMRVKCATLAWHAMKKALGSHESRVVSHEGRGGLASRDS
jgi:nitrogen fixation protein NifU and related proteins